jgi:hypothetical protein
MSRLVGICVSSSRVKVTPVSTCRVSISGVALVTVTASETRETVSEISSSVSLPRVMMTFSYVTVLNPGIVMVS